jgi:hypothetical protein
MDASNESRNAHDSLKVDLDHVERRRIVTVRLRQLKAQLVGERSLARVARAECRYFWSGASGDRTSDLLLAKGVLMP